MSDQKWITTSAGVQMPRILYGTAWKKERTAALVVQAIQAGFRGIDTACQPKHYDERLVGVALREVKDQGVAREALYLQTKFTPLSGQEPGQVPYDEHASLERQVAQSFETSQKNLQTDYVDCLILHSPLASHALTMQAWRAMEAIHQAGGARQLGISNCYDGEVLKGLYADAEIKPAILQNRFYREAGYDTALRRWCHNQGMIYESFWSLTANTPVLASNVLQALAQKHRRTVAQIFFRYLSQSGIVPLTGTSSARHMQEDLDIFAFALSPDALNAVSGLLI